MKVFMCVADVHVHMPLLADAGLHLGIAGQGSFFAQILRNVILTVLVWLGPGCSASFSEKKHYVHVLEGSRPRWLDAGLQKYKKGEQSLDQSDQILISGCILCSYLWRVSDEGIGQYGFSRPRRWAGLSSLQSIGCPLPFFFKPFTVAFLNAFLMCPPWLGCWSVRWTKWQNRSLCLVPKLGKPLSPYTTKKGALMG